MSGKEKGELKARLIEMGFWRPAQLGDPTIDKYAAEALHNQTEEKLAGGTFLTSTRYSPGSPALKIEVQHGEFHYVLADGDNYPEAICQAALALPVFLKQHPECAA